MKLGLCDDFRPKKIYIGSKYGGAWYHKTEEGNFEEIKAPGIRGYFVGAYAYESTRQNKEVAKLGIGLDCGEQSYVLEVGLSTIFAKEFLLTISQQPPEALSEPIVIEPQAGTEVGSLTFCRVYVNRRPVKYALPYGSKIGEYLPSEFEMRELATRANELVGARAIAPQPERTIEPVYETKKIAPQQKKIAAPVSTSPSFVSLPDILRQIAPIVEGYGYDISAARIANYCRKVAQCDRFEDMSEFKQAEMLEKMAIDFLKRIGQEERATKMQGIARSPDTAIPEIQKFARWLESSPPPY